MDDWIDQQVEWTNEIDRVPFLVFSRDYRVRFVNRGMETDPVPGTVDIWVVGPRSTQK